MRKTLRNILFGSVLATATFAAGIGIGTGTDIIRNMKKVQEKQNASYISESFAEKQGNKTSKSIEDYLLNKNEQNSVNFVSSENISNNCLNSQNTKEGVASNVMVGNYKIPKIEENSSEKELSLTVMEFKSAKEREEFIKNPYMELSSPVFVQDNFVSIIKPNLKDMESFSPGQKEIYNSILNDYAKRTGAEEISGLNNSPGQVITSNLDSFSKEQASQPVIVTANSELEDLFLNEKEKSGISKMTMEYEAKLLNTSVEKMKEKGFVPSYKLNHRSILDGNPYIEGEKGIDEINAEERQLRNLAGYGEAIYFIPSGKEERQNTGNTAFIDFSIYEFDSKESAREAISNMEGYSKSIDNLILTKGNEIIVIDARSQINSPSQAAAYTDSMLNYMERTGARISAENEQIRSYLGEVLIKANKAIRNPSAYNFSSADVVLESYFASTAESRKAHAMQAETNEKYLSQ